MRRSAPPSRFALESLERLAVLQILRVHGARDHVERQHVVQLPLVLGLEQLRDDAGGQGGEGLVVRHWRARVRSHRVNLYRQHDLLQNRQQNLLQPRLQPRSQHLQG